MSIFPERLEAWFREAAPEVRFCSLRYVGERSEQLSVRRGVVEPIASGDDAGVMITVIDGDGLGYAGTCDLSPEGLGRALNRARDWARRTAARMAFSATPLQEACQGDYQTPVSIPWDSVPLREKIDLLRAESERLHTDPRIVDWDASLWHSETETLYLTADGTRIHQTLSQLLPTLGCTANGRSRDGEPYLRREGLLPPGRHRGVGADRVPGRGAGFGAGSPGAFGGAQLPGRDHGSVAGPRPAHSPGA